MIRLSNVISPLCLDLTHSLRLCRTRVFPNLKKPDLGKGNNTAKKSGDVEFLPLYRLYQSST